jgi:glyoxylase-like metal-dependent hydrolase (beta-lactamase superfamily II)
MVIKTFVNSIFNSNTHIIYKEDTSDVWVIDPGSCINELIEWTNRHKKNVSTVLLTHAHFDHIMGLSRLIDKFPNSKIYASPYAVDKFESDKLNGSYYKEIPFTVDCKDYTRVKEGDTIKMWEDCEIKVLETPGHGIDCVSFYVNGNLFTGDALIPGVKVFTKNKDANKTDAARSIKRLIEKFDANTMIWAGHEKNCSLGTIIEQDFPLYSVK